MIKKTKLKRNILSSVCFVLIIVAFVYYLYDSNKIKENKKTGSSTPLLRETKIAQIEIDGVQYFSKGCTVSLAKYVDNKRVEEDVFTVPGRFMTLCKEWGEPLTYDGEYIIFNVCEIAYGAGGCGGGRYRSKDNKNWEEYIGVTWLKGEEYAAWRKVGSISSKADSIEKIN